MKVSISINMKATHLDQKWQGILKDSSYKELT